MKTQAPRLRLRGAAERFVAHPLARVLIALRVHPNVLTLVGFGVAAGAAWLLADGRILAGGAVMLAGAAMDMLDGSVARLSSKASAFGAFLDSVMDRLGEAVVLFGLAAFYARLGHELGVLLAFGALTASLMVSYMRARAEGLIAGQSDVGFLGRPERVVVLGAALLLGYPLYGLGVIAALGVLTMAQRAWHVLRAARGG